MEHVIDSAIIYMTYFKEKALKIKEKVTSRRINYLIAGAILKFSREQHIKTK